LRVVVGLGNPGQRYRRTRHNMGFLVADALGSKIGVRSSREESDAWVAELDFPGDPVWLVKPLTFMNRSGLALAPVLERAEAKAADIVVVLDDFQFGLGTLRIRERGGHGGHNGLRSIIETLGTEDFPRVRVGIGTPDAADVAEFVLGEFRDEEILVVQETVGWATESVECFLKEGLAVAMNRFNGPRPS
jgi:PTH1 family peptidyl-tRNA hydrolase